MIPLSIHPSASLGRGEMEDAFSRRATVERKIDSLFTVSGIDWSEPMKKESNAPGFKQAASSDVNIPFKEVVHDEDKERLRVVRTSVGRAE